jgi:hypothetical protein
MREVIYTNFDEAYFWEKSSSGNYGGLFYSKYKFPKPLHPLIEIKPYLADTRACYVLVKNRNTGMYAFVDRKTNTLSKMKFHDMVPCRVVLKTAKILVANSLLGNMDFIKKLGDENDQTSAI